jgi:hypothetical protein
MHYINFEQSKQSKAKTKSNTSNSSVRDRARLQQLQKLHPTSDIITWSSQESTSTSKNHHSGFWSSRGVQTFLDKFEASHFIEHIYIDYFRFPSQYGQEYFNNIATILPELISSMIKTTILLYLPIIKNTDTFTSNSFISTLTTFKNTKLNMKRRPIDANQNPLYVSTTNTAQSDLGNYINESQISLLELKPFILVEIK